MYSERLAVESKDEKIRDLEEQVTSELNVGDQAE